MYNIMLSYPLFGKGMQILQSTTELFVSNSGDLAPYMDKLRAADAFITRNVHPSTQMLETCPNLKIIGIPGVGYQSYDMDYLNSRGIAVVYCPAMNLRAVAEHAVGMAYAMTKWIPRDDREVRRGNYGIRNAFDHLELQGCKVGIAGFGAIGRETARLFRANGMEVYIYDPYATKADAEGLGCHYCATLEALLPQVRILSLHMPSLPTTYHMFDEKAFAAMADGVYFINCARGSVVDEAALYNALVSGKVAAAALDVMEKEPFDLENPLLSLPNVIVTPHVGGVTAQTSERIHERVVTSTLSLLSGIRVDNVANPEALKHPRWDFLRGGEDRGAGK